MLFGSKCIGVKAQKKGTGIKNGKYEQHGRQDIIAYTSTSLVLDKKECHQNGLENGYQTYRV
jgi:hypothetical protein